MRFAVVALVLPALACSGVSSSSGRDCSVAETRTVVFLPTGDEFSHSASVSLREACWSVRAASAIDPEHVAHQMRSDWASSLGSSLFPSAAESHLKLLPEQYPAVPIRVSSVSQWLTVCEEGGSPCARHFHVTLEDGVQLFFSGFPGTPLLESVYPANVTVF